MLRNGHVRFGRRPAETHQPQDWQGAAGRPHTEHWTGQGKVYLCAIKDEWSNRIVGYSISDRMKSTLAVDALNMAVARRGNVTGWPPPATTPPWNPSSPCSRRTSWTGAAGPPANNSDSRSSPGSNGPTTADADKPASAD